MPADSVTSESTELPTDRRWPFRSLKGRLLIGSLISLPLLLLLAAFIVEKAFRESLISAENNALQSAFYLLLEATDWQNQSLNLPDTLTEPRFSQIDSGLYGKIADQQNQPLWQSTSAEFSELSLPLPAQPFAAGSRALTEITIEDQSFFVFSFDVIWEFEAETEQSLRYVVYHHKHAFEAEIAQFRRTLRTGLGIMAAGLILTQWLILLWGLRPLQQLKSEIDALESADQHSVTGRYPEEIERVTGSLNRVLASERNQRERYHQTLGNLAHSIKTPLAVIKGEIEKDEKTKGVLDEQVDQIDEIIRRQLQRSVIQSAGHFHQTTLIKPIADRLISALDKVYREKHISFENHLAADVGLKIDQQDLFELLGNILENACKYGKSRIHINAVNSEQSTQLWVEDDGRGIAPEDASRLLKRGSRADTQAAGQGLGLAIANDIVNSYQGRLEIGTSNTLGGAKITVICP